MKTKDLIAALNEADPSGEIECCIGNADISDVYAEPAYWDGCLQTLIYDSSENVVGAKYTGIGKKVIIRPFSISDAIFNIDDNLPVDFSELTENQRERYEKAISKRRVETRNIHNEVERESFVKYVCQRLVSQAGEDFSKEEVSKAAIDFYDANMSYKDKMPEDILKSKIDMEINGKIHKVGPSWNERREMQWDREIAILFNEGSVVLNFV